MKHPSLASISESELVRRLVSDTLWRPLLLDIADLPEHGEPLLEVPLAGFEGNPAGDIDILLCANDVAEPSTAIQVKKIKLNATQLRSGKPSKMNAYRKGVQQANLLSDLGFALVYLYVILVVDSREQNQGKHTYEGHSNLIKHVIDQHLSLEGLRHEIGVAHVDLVQPMDYEPLLVGTHGLDLVRKAVRTSQSAQVTSWINAKRRCPSASW